MRNSRSKIVLSGVIVLAVLAATLAVMSPVSADNPPSQSYLANATWLDPLNSDVAYDDSPNTTQVDIWLNTSVACAGGQLNITYDTGCANVTIATINQTNWGMSAPPDLSTPGKVWMVPAALAGVTHTGNTHVGTLTIQCINASYCETNLTFDKDSKWVTPAPATDIEMTWHNGTFTCKNIPDLVVSDLSPQVEDPASGTYKVNYTVTNTGNAAAGEFWVNLTVNGAQNATEYVSGLAASASYTGDFSSHIEAVSGDNDTIMVCADFNNTVDEKTYEDNNCDTKEFFAALTVDIGNYVILHGASKKAPITVRSMKDYGVSRTRVEFNESVVVVTSVGSSADSIITGHTPLTEANANGAINISAWNLGGSGSTEDVILAYVTFHDVGGAGTSTVLNLTTFELKDISYNKINTNDLNGSITISENDPPNVTNATVSEPQILNYADGRDRPAGSYETTLSVNVTDNSSFTVTIDLSSIGGDSNVSMTPAGTGDLYSVGIDSVNGTNIGTAGVDETHCFMVNATDTSGNSNTLVCIGPLEILRRGDVVHDNSVDMGDALYIARYSIGLEPTAPDNFVFVGDVVGEGGAADMTDGVDMGDALYIARYTVGNEGAP